MIEFSRIDPAFKDTYNRYLAADRRQGCEFSFANVSIWGRQRMAVLHDHVVLFSQFGRCSVYPFPLGAGDIRPVLDAIIQDARERGIPCRISSLSKEHCDLLQQLYPGKFRFHTNRDDYDYVYRTEDLALLKGKKYQSKRNFCNRFWSANPTCRLEPMEQRHLDAVRQMLDAWYENRMAADPYNDFHLEQVALGRALDKWQALGMEGMVLMEEEKVLAFTMGSPLGESTFDIHFEKALDIADGAYNVINQGFAQYLMEKHPEITWLNREDDLGLPGLRKAKLSYQPDHLVEKYWARLWEDDDDC